MHEEGSTGGGGEKEGEMRKGEIHIKFQGEFEHVRTLYEAGLCTVAGARKLREAMKSFSPEELLFLQALIEDRATKALTSPPASQLAYKPGGPL